MTNYIRPLSAAALLAIVLPVHAGLPPKSPAPPPAPTAEAPVSAPLPTAPGDKDLVWPPELKEGRRAWSVTALELKSMQTRRTPGDKVPANAELRLGQSMKDRSGVEWWSVEAVASDASGWTRTDTLTRTWPKGDADSLAPMLGDRSAEVAAVLDRLNSADVKTRIIAAKQLCETPAGITDEKLFDTIAARVVQGLDRTGTANAVMWAGMFGGIIGQGIATSAVSKSGEAPFNPRHWAQEVVWLTKALATSGYTKYRPVLERAAELDSLAAMKVADHANAALDELEKFARWNRIVNDPASHKLDEPYESTRIRNMLHSGERRLQRGATNRVVELKQPALFDEVEAEFLRVYKQPLESEQSDAVAHMARTLGRSGNAKYRTTLEDAAKNASTSEVKRHAAKAAKELPAV